ncbi:MAG: putative murein peptide carboxypeptidase [Alphaproteobacteria bacterium ADurb.Bin438]|nr:MAG: putative murein peptide carboxypeptidase [Alphaproteobacteria bacterium ADurb.Bin438]
MKIGFISPASHVVYEDIKNAINYFENQGHKIVLSKNIYKQERFMAGSDEERLSDLHDMFADKSVDFIIATRGAYGSPRLLDKIDYELIKQNKKGFIGLSDVTALSLAMYKMAGLSSYTGMVIKSDFKDETLPPLLKQSLNHALNHQKQSFKDLEIYNKGKAEGILVGGNLTMIMSLMGTPYEVDFQDKILFIEEIGEEPFRVDRMINQLRLANVFNKIKGLIIGDFTVKLSKDKLDGTLDEVFYEQFKHLNIPIINNFLNGHIKEKYLLKIGAKIFLDCVNGEIHEM